MYLLSNAEKAINDLKFCLTEHGLSSHRPSYKREQPIPPNLEDYPENSCFSMMSASLAMSDL
jgi:hypothetical protein